MAEHRQESPTISTVREQIIARLEAVLRAREQAVRAELKTDSAYAFFRGMYPDPGDLEGHR